MGALLKKDVEVLRKSLLDHLTYSIAKDKYSATSRDKYDSLVLSVRDFLVERWIKTQQQYYDVDTKRVYYLSLEFLLGRLLDNYALNVGLSGEYRKAVSSIGISYE